MRPVKPAGDITPFAKPKDWDDRNGPCGDLPVRRVVEGVAAKNPYLAMYSNWQPSSDELARLNAGHVVELCCCGGQPAVSISVVPCADEGAQRESPRNSEAIRGAVARGWCHPTNTLKEMDSDLAEAISIEVAKLFNCPFPGKDSVPCGSIEGNRNEGLYGDNQGAGG